MNFIITGGAGFIGSHLIDCINLRFPGSIIVVVDNLYLGRRKNIYGNNRNSTVIFYNADASCYEVMNNLIDLHAIDVIFDLAVVPLPVSLHRPLWVWQQNIKIVECLCELASIGKIKRYVHFSSSEAYGTAKKIPMSEEHLITPRTAYGASKAATDHLILSYVENFGIDARIVRPFNAFGPRQNDKTYAGVIPITINRILSGQSPIIYGTGEQTRDYTYVVDIVNAAIDICFSSAIKNGDIINIASGKETSILLLIEKIAEFMLYHGAIDYQNERDADVFRHCADISKAKQLIGYSPVTSIDDGLKKTIEYFRDNYE